MGKYTCGCIKSRVFFGFVRRICCFHRFIIPGEALRRPRFVERRLDSLPYCHPNRPASCGAELRRYVFHQFSSGCGKILVLSARHAMIFAGRGLWKMARGYFSDMVFISFLAIFWRMRVFLYWISGIPATYCVRCVVTGMGTIVLCGLQIKEIREQFPSRVCLVAHDGVFSSQR